MKNLRKIVIDFETTGYSPQKNDVIEIGAIELNEEGVVIASFETLVYTDQIISDRIIKITGINNSMLSTAPKKKQAVEKFLEFLGDKEFLLIGHNAKRFDSAFYDELMKNVVAPKYIVYDTMLQMRFDLSGGNAKNFIIAQKEKVKLKRTVKTNLEAACIHYRVKQKKQHRAFADCEVTGKVFYNQVKNNKWKRKLF